MKTVRAGLLILLALAIGAFALTLRMAAVERLPLDYDEPVYLGVAQRSAWRSDMRHGWKTATYALLSTTASTTNIRR
ncbi:MAG: hypothetical protein MUC34_17450 [Anaerolineae bacterium]|nr:hypothetical protein [Anaerolineae bacterium]